MSATMSATVRPRRSVLYMPGSNIRALEKAKGLAADVLILDLEDAVAPDAKAEARRNVCNAVKQGGYGGRELIIRTNGFDTPWGRDDVRDAAIANPDAILLPKVESAATVQEAEKIMLAANPDCTATIWCMMETPKGILHAEEIAFARLLIPGRLGGFVMGTSDLAKDLHALHTPMRLPLLTSLSICLLAARAAGLAIVDGVHLDLNDEEGFKAACLQGLELGFDGKTLIHPKQLAAANEVFAPSAAVVEYSRHMIAAFEAAQAEGKGVVLLDGKLIENLHVENAKRLVALADAIRALETSAGAGA
jgi:citrate lyase subunit beta/citryl-CoA lyase